MKIRKLTALALCVALLAVVLSACGGSDGTDKTNPNSDGVSEVGSGKAEYAVILKTLSNDFWATMKKGIEDEAKKLSHLLFKPNGSLSPEVVGKSARHLAGIAGFSVPRDTQVLVARCRDVGPGFPYSMEKLCPVLALFVEEDEAAVLRRAKQILHFEGKGHTFCIHARDEAVIRRFALQMPVSRFLVNTPAALGGIGQSTGLFPALTLGCGAVGGSASSNNVSPMDLINIRRVAWGQEEQTQSPGVDEDLVELLTARILERLR